MKLLILYFMCAVPAMAGTCETEVARIRMMPARLISNADYEKMLNGCGRDYSHPILPSFDALVDDSEKAQAAAANAGEQAYLKATIQNIQETRALNASFSARLSADLAAQRAAISAPVAPVTVTTYQFGNTTISEIQ